MTDKEFKRLSRAQLIDIIYQFQLQVDKLTEENQKLERELADKRLRLNNAGSIADAAIEINNCFSNAQNAAEQYLNEIKVSQEATDAERRRILDKARAEASAIVAAAKRKQKDSDAAIASSLEKAEAERRRILAQAQADASVIMSGAKDKRKDLDAAIEVILAEYNQSHSDNR